MCRALIVDDEPDVLFLLRLAIEMSDLGLTVAGEATGELEAVERWREVRPDVIVLDQRMPDGTGLHAARTIRAEDPEQAIILFTAQLGPELVADAAEVGIRCMAKDQLFAIPQACKDRCTDGC